MEELYSRLRELRLAREQGSIGQAALHGLTLGYKGRAPKGAAQWVAWLIANLPAFYVTRGASAFAVGKTGLAASRPLLAASLREAGGLGALGAISKPMEGETRLGAALTGAGVGAAFPIAGRGLSRLLRRPPRAVPSPGPTFEEAPKLPLLSPILPAHTLVEKLPPAVGVPMRQVVERLIRGERELPLLETTSLERLTEARRPLKAGSPELQQVLAALQGRTREEALAELPSELHEPWRRLRHGLNLEWVGQQLAERRRITEQFGERGIPPRLARRQATALAPLAPPRKGYYPYGATANYFVLEPAAEAGLVSELADEGLLESAERGFKLIPGRGVAATRREAEEVAARYAAESGTPIESLKIIERGPAGPHMEGFGLPRPTFWALVNRLAGAQGVKPQELLKELGPELPIRVRPAKWARGKFKGFRQQRLGKLAPPEPAWEDLERYVVQSAQFKAMTGPLAFAGRRREAILGLAGGEQTPLGQYWERYLQGVAGQPSKWEQRVLDGLTNLAQQDTTLGRLASRYAGDPFAVRRISGGIRGLETLAKLGFSLSAPLWNMAQLSNLVGVTSLRETMAAAREVIFHPERWERVFEQAGVIPLSGKVGQMTLEELGGPIKAIYPAAMWLFNKSEQFLQRAAVVAGFKRGGMEEARRVLIRTMFHYGKADVPEILRGPFGAVIGQFKPYLLNQMFFILGMNRREAMRYFPVLMALAGTGAIPFKEQFDDIAYLFTEESPISELEVRHPRLTTGLPGLAGVSTQMPLGVTEGLVPDTSAMAFGPFLSDIIRAVRAERAGELGPAHALSPFVALRRSLSWARTLGQGGVRVPETGELIYRIPGQPTRRLRGASPAETRRLNIEQITRMRQTVPLVGRRRFHERAEAVRRETARATVPRAVLLQAAGLTPTELRAHRVLRKLQARERERYRRQRRKGTPLREVYE